MHGPGAVQGARALMPSQALEPLVSSWGLSTQAAGGWREASFPTGSPVPPGPSPWATASNPARLQGNRNPTACFAWAPLSWLGGWHRRFLPHGATPGPGRASASRPSPRQVLQGNAPLGSCTRAPGCKMSLRFLSPSSTSTQRQPGDRVWPHDWPSERSNSTSRDSEERSVAFYEWVTELL